MQLSSFNLNPDDIPANVLEIRKEVRDFLARERAAGSYKRTAPGWDRYDPDFSRKIGQQGWIGITWPKKYGGAERTSLERYVVAEELLTSGAPVRGHWLADRQIGPLLLSVGTDAQKSEFLPKIAAGECYFCVGLSEPDSGSDLSSIRTFAKRVDGGWLVNGTKVWTSYAHRAHYMNLFARTTARDETDRHSGVTQFIVDLKASGVSISPIVNMAGDHDFNEVAITDLFLPDDRVIGEVGGAWKQVSAELAHERSGSERWVNSYSALTALADQFAGQPDRGGHDRFGRLVAHIWTLHRMSFSIAAMLQKGELPMVEAALVKDLGTIFDQEVPASVREILGESERASLPSDFNDAVAHSQLYAPAASIRGGTREILRGIIARGLGLR